MGKMKFSVFTVTCLLLANLTLQGGHSDAHKCVKIVHEASKELIEHGSLKEAKHEMDKHHDDAIKHRCRQAEIYHPEINEKPECNRLIVQIYGYFAQDKTERNSRKGAEALSNQVKNRLEKFGKECHDEKHKSLIYF